MGGTGSPLTGKENLGGVLVETMVAKREYSLLAVSQVVVGTGSCIRC